ncbi:MAG: ATP-dependent DNA helicase PIF1 [Parcubacteria bacterium C7867-006]|nr:MAG: ATP-dependent DNA helicase PIF1 [Parcubacteria bacterium C7867-006]
MFSMTQAEALDILKMGKNVFLTGPAGSGKTHVVNAYVKYLKQHAVDVAVTASTGIAATHIGGQTIHSWSGLGVKDTLTDYDIESLMERQYLYKRFEKTKVLIIDEVSMLHHFRLDLIEWICRQMKRNEAPFGGMQIILCGDFFQLPPVSRRRFDGMDFIEPVESEFAFKAESFLTSKFTICYLSEQHRQKDNTYLSILNQIRQNKVTQKTVDLLKTRLNVDPDTGAVVTRLYTHNIDVDEINKKHLSLIDAGEKDYHMTSKGASSLVESLKKSCLSPEVLVLKKGARVMFTKNQPEGGFVNGTLGIVKDFNQFGDPIVETNSGMTFHVSPQAWKIEEEGKVKAEINQLPLRLAWAITVHKSQGMSLDAMEVDLSKSFVKGMGYVALSRVRSLNGMKLLGFNDMSLEVDMEVLEMDEKFREKSDEAVDKLKSMKRSEIEEKQRLFIESIEPEEKVKIKKKEKELKKSTHEITAEMLEKEMSLAMIADKRGIKQETVVSHIEDLMKENKCPDIDYLKKELKRSELDEILSVFEELDTDTLSPVYNLLLKRKKKPSYLKIRLARLFLNK